MFAEATGEPIPTVVISCIRVLSQFALQHQGLFRISGSQIEINRMRDAFETGLLFLRIYQNNGLQF
jgi:SLIT-ROBO Rho GTPase activating protein